MDMSNKEINVALSYIQIRNHNHFAAQASLHGKKVPLRHTNTSQKTTNTKFSSEEERKIEDTINRHLMKTRGKKLGG